jgi:glycosyltransferase involved in cell wall biosynthesis
MRTAAFTIIAPNRRHYARLLMASIAEHEPAWDRVALMVGATEPPALEPGFTIETLEALPLPRPRAFTFRYTIRELCPAVKPWMFAHLFALGYDRVVYFDPDIALFSSLAELRTVELDTLMLLTPHVTVPIDGDDPTGERPFLQSGAYNLGFLAVWRHPAQQDFLRWWQSRLETRCVAEVERGLFVDQKWLDLAPGLFPGVAVLRHDGWNVAYWNLRQRTVRNGGGRLTVNGAPLRFFHFSGVEPTLPGLVSKHDARLSLDEIGAARPLVERYREALREQGQAEFERAPYAYARFVDGSPIPDAARLAYRRSAELQEACGDDPFAHPGRFRGMRDRTRVPATARIALQSYQLLSKPRMLVGLLPKPVRTAMREMLIGAPPAVGPHVPDDMTDAALPFGLSVVGYHQRESGIGESARLCHRACRQVGLPGEALDVDVLDLAPVSPHYGATIVHVNADRLPELVRRHPAIFRSGGWTIGCWHWELGEWPEAWATAAAPLDEIWVPSTFIQRALSRLVDIPVVHMPHGIAVDEVEPCPLEPFGVAPGTFTFLSMFDVDSVVARKHPRAAVDAFARAFPGPSGPALVIKVRGTDAFAGEREAMVASLQSLPRVHVIDEAMSRARANGLIAACDAVVSLHRAEGFGLVLAEAMCLGKPVVATGWSGNMDFMDGANACPVRYTLVRSERAHGPYPAGAEWAEPDVEHAADLMRRVVEDRAWREAIGARARATIQDRLSPEVAARRYHDRLARLG